MKEIRSIAILGAGALGAFYASRLVGVPEFSVCLLARGERAGRLRQAGLRVNGEDFLVPVVEPEAVHEPVDLVLVALKHGQLQEAIPDLRPLVGPGTLIVSVLNGLDSEERIGAVYGMDKLLYCVAVGIDAVRRDGEVDCAHAGFLYFGEARNDPPGPRVQRVQRALDRAGLPWRTPPDMLRMLWWKFMVNVGVNQASAVMRAPYGVCQSSPDAQAVMETLMREVIAVAGSAGIGLGEPDLEEWRGVLSRLAPEGKTSMLQDIEAGRPTEVEIFAGKVVELGLRYAIPTPANQLMLQLIRVLERPQG